LVKNYIIYLEYILTTVTMARSEVRLMHPRFSLIMSTTFTYRLCSKSFRVDKENDLSADVSSVHADMTIWSWYKHVVNYICPEVVAEFEAVSTNPAETAATATANDGAVARKNLMNSVASLLRSIIVTVTAHDGSNVSDTPLLLSLTSASVFDESLYFSSPEDRNPIDECISVFIRKNIASLKRREAFENDFSDVLTAGWYDRWKYTEHSIGESAECLDWSKVLTAFPRGPTGILMPYSEYSRLLSCSGDRASSSTDYTIYTFNISRYYHPAQKDVQRIHDEGGSAVLYIHRRHRLQNQVPGDDGQAALSAQMKDMYGALVDFDDWLFYQHDYECAFVEARHPGTSRKILTEIYFKIPTVDTDAIARIECADGIPPRVADQFKCMVEKRHIDNDS